MDLRTRITKLDCWRRYLFYSTIVFFVSLFLSWADTGIISLNGWQRLYYFNCFRIEGWLLLIPVVYNLEFAFGQIKTKWFAYCMNIFVVLFLISYITGMTVSFLESNINLAGLGSWLALVAFLANIYFIYKVDSKK